jgi:hypothetical protein
MTEQEWLQTSDPMPMLVFLQGKASDRKLQFFVMACCRQIWPSFTDERSRRSIEVAEQFADGDATIEELIQACNVARGAAEQVCWDLVRLTAWTTTWLHIYSQIDEESNDDSGIARTLVFCTGETGRGGRVIERELEKKGQTDLFRDIFGNPFRPITIAPSLLRWHNGLIVSIARQMYDNRDFIDMPILADALEEAGCTNVDILMHCRHPGEHVRGCWLVDLLLGKE